MDALAFRESRRTLLQGFDIRDVGRQRAISRLAAVGPITGREPVAGEPSEELFDRAQLQRRWMFEKRRRGPRAGSGAPEFLVSAWVCSQEAEEKFDALETGLMCEVDGHLFFV